MPRKTIASLEKTIEQQSLEIEKQKNLVRYAHELSGELGDLVGNLGADRNELIRRVEDATTELEEAAKVIRDQQFYLNEKQQQFEDVTKNYNAIMALLADRYGV